MDFESASFLRTVGNDTCELLHAWPALKAPVLRVDSGTSMATKYLYAFSDKIITTQDRHAAITLLFLVASVIVVLLSGVLVLAGVYPVSAAFLIALAVAYSVYVYRQRRAVKEMFVTLRQELTRFIEENQSESFVAYSGGFYIVFEMKPMKDRPASEKSSRVLTPAPSYSRTNDPASSQLLYQNYFEDSGINSSPEKEPGDLARFPSFDDANLDQSGAEDSAEEQEAHAATNPEISFVSEKPGNYSQDEDGNNSDGHHP